MGIPHPPSSFSHGLNSTRGRGQKSLSFHRHWPVYFDRRFLDTLPGDLRFHSAAAGIALGWSPVFALPTNSRLTDTTLLQKMWMPSLPLPARSCFRNLPTDVRAPLSGGKALEDCHSPCGMVVYGKVWGRWAILVPKVGFLLLGCFPAVNSGSAFVFASPDFNIKLSVGCL
jgi:hypothetical protein